MCNNSPFWLVRKKLYWCVAKFGKTLTFANSFWQKNTVESIVNKLTDEKIEVNEKFKNIKKQETHGYDKRFIYSHDIAI